MFKFTHPVTDESVVITETGIAALDSAGNIVNSLDGPITSSEAANAIVVLTASCWIPDDNTYEKLFV